MAGSQNVFVAKLNSAGNGLLYSTYLGGSGTDTGLGIAVDRAGDAYVTGGTQSSNFPTAHALYPTLKGVRNAFVTELGPSGSTLLYSTYLGGTNGDSGYAIAVDSGNNTYVTGYTNSLDFPVTAGAYRTELATGATQDVFIARISSAN